MIRFFAAIIVSLARSFRIGPFRIRPVAGVRLGRPRSADRWHHRQSPD